MNNIIEITAPQGRNLRAALIDAASILQDEPEDSVLIVRCAGTDATLLRGRLGIILGLTAHNKTSLAFAWPASTLKH
jgi:hypothetical protein